MKDKRINKQGLVELLCYSCMKWKVYAGGEHADNWAFFPESQHECRACYDKFQSQEGEEYDGSVEFTGEIL